MACHGITGVRRARTEAFPWRADFLAERGWSGVFQLPTVYFVKEVIFILTLKYIGEYP